MWPANLALFFTFQPISFKQLNSLATIDTFSWRSGLEVTHPPGVRDVLGSIPGSGKVYVWFCVLLLLCSYFFVKNTFFVKNFCNSFCSCNSFSILNILQNLWPIISVKCIKMHLNCLYLSACISTMKMVISS